MEIKEMILGIIGIIIGILVLIAGIYYLATDKEENAKKIYSTASAVGAIITAVSFFILISNL